MGARRVLVMGGAPVDNVALAVHGGPAALARYLDERLLLARHSPNEIAKLVEAECLRGLSELNRAPEPEHGRPTGRRAGGGRLTKGA